MKRLSIFLVALGALACEQVEGPVVPIPSLTAQLDLLSVEGPSVETVWGPETATRGRGKPAPIDLAIEIPHPHLFEVQMILRVESVGGSVPSAQVFLDGVELLRQSDFPLPGGLWESPVDLSRGGILSVTLYGKPGLGLRFSVLGVRRRARIAFVTTASGNDEIAFRDEGSSQVFFPAPHSAVDQHPVFSPNGSQIVFSSTRSGNWEVWMVNLDGSGLRQLSNHTAVDFGPRWHPDGEHVGWSSNRSGKFEIYKASIASWDAEQLTDLPADAGTHWWSPDGTRMAFQVGRQPEFDIWIADGDGANATQLTHLAGREVSPQWSPTGDWLTFFRDSGTTADGDVYVISLQDRVPINLTGSSSSSDTHPTWDPTGTKILFSSRRAGSDGLDLYVIDDLNEPTPRKLIGGAGDQFHAFWDLVR